MYMKTKMTKNGRSYKPVVTLQTDSEATGIFFLNLHHTKYNTYSWPHAVSLFLLSPGLNSVIDEPLFFDSATVVSLWYGMVQVFNVLFDTL